MGQQSRHQWTLKATVSSRVLAKTGFSSESSAEGQSTSRDYFCFLMTVVSMVACFFRASSVEVDPQNRHYFYNLCLLPQVNVKASKQIWKFHLGPQGREWWGGDLSCAIYLPQLLGAKCWVFEMRKSTAVCEEVSKQVDPAEVWIRSSISCKT